MYIHCGPFNEWVVLIDRGLKGVMREVFGEGVGVRQLLTTLDRNFRSNANVRC